MINVPEVCGHPKFPQQMSVNSGAKEQTWWLEVSKLTDSYVCSIQHNGYGSLESVHFDQFALNFDSEIPKGTEIRTKLSHPDRIPFDEEEYEITENGVKTTDSFTHSVRFVQIRYSN